MTPAARAQAAIEVLDRWLSGEAAERALIGWARSSRFAGSGDRQAVRDLVFDAIRRRDSAARRGGGLSGRGLVLGLLRDGAEDPGTVFTGARHAPAPLSPAEAADPGPATGPAALDLPASLEDPLREALGEDLASVMALMRRRAPVFLRVNLARVTRARALLRLAGEGIAAREVDGVKTALEVTGNARKIQTCDVFLDGLVEPQDAASQAAVLMLPLADGARVLDYCAGGGGKTLAMAGLAGVEAFAHDADPRRMADLPRRAARAGVRVRLLATAQLPAHGPFDLVLADLPCTGSGTWRRSPEAKWTTTPAGIAAFAARQAKILDEAASLVAPGGRLAAMTCSVFRAENEAQTAGFVARNPGWRVVAERRFRPGAPGDGFHASLFARLP